MCNKANLSNRVKKAKAAMLFAKVQQYDAEGRIRAVIVPGSQGKQYHIILKRNKGSFVTEVNLLVNGNLVAPSWKAQHISYHVMAAIELAAQEHSYNVIWFANFQDAKRYSNFGGQLFKVINKDNPNVYEWAVMEKE